MNYPSLYRLLESPKVFSISQKLLAPEAELLLKKHSKDVFAQSKGMILDVGCGPTLSTSMPDGIIVGVDISPRYIRNYINIDTRIDSHYIKGRTSKRTRFGIACSAESLPFNDNIFDESRCMGLLHHLNWEFALSAIKEMVRCTRSNGKIVIFDSVWPKVTAYRPIAWLLCRFDRGRYMLTEEELLRLVDTAYSGNWKYKRFTYTLTGLEGCLLTIQKTG